MKYIYPYAQCIHNNQDMETNCALAYEWIKKTWHIYNEMLLKKKKENPIICDNMDELGGLFVMWNKLDKDK